MESFVPAWTMSRGGTYGYGYDNIGNRKTSREGTTASVDYEVNVLNQYTSIEEGEQTAFIRDMMLPDQDGYRGMGCCLQCPEPGGELHARQQARGMPLRLHGKASGEIRL